MEKIEYIKFEIDNLTNYHVFCHYREITEEGKSEIKNRVFPLEKLTEELSVVSEMVKGLTTIIYYEQNGNQIITEKKDLFPKK